MKVGTLLGIILIALGALGLAYGGITYTKSRETVGVGPVRVTAERKETVPIAPIVSGIAIVAGIALVVGTRRAR
ncbi:MAG TPA: hypothetical protein VNA89_16400 [Gemmatimonadaceae bacterium]|nr:hypothetical protein [Gemmatimonadaceae bacterium]